MTIKDNILYNSPNYRTGRKITPKGLMLHSVGCPQPSAPVFCKLFANYGAAGVHAFIDANNGIVYQTLPWNHRAWHCGGAANNTHVGVEMCESSAIRYTSGTSIQLKNKVQAQADCRLAYNSAVELFAFLCKKYDLNPLKDGVIISHREGARRGLASNHGDPEHYWKGCGMSYTMDGFRRDVYKHMTGQITTDQPTTHKASSTLYRVRKTWADTNSQTGAFHVLALAKLACKPGYTVYDSNGKAVYTKAKTQTKTDYKVKVTINDLNIRKAPGLDSKVKGTCKPGIYTIIAEQHADGIAWGKLKSGAGWISLAYAQKV